MRIITTALIAALTACGTEIPDHSWIMAMEDTASDMEDTAMEDTAGDTDEFLLEGTAHVFSVGLILEDPEDEAEVHIVVVKSEDSDFFTDDDFFAGNPLCGVAQAFCMEFETENDIEIETGIALNDGVGARHHVAAVHNMGESTITVSVQLHTWTGDSFTTALTIEGNQMRCAGIVNPTTPDVAWADCTEKWDNFIVEAE